MKSVLHLISSKSVYGAEKVLLNLVNELKSSKYSQIIGNIGSDKNELCYEASKLGITVLSIGGNLRFNFYLIIELCRIIRDNKIDLIHSHGYKGTIAGYLASLCNKIPMIVTCHLWYNTNDIKLKVYHYLESIVMKKLPAIVGVSETICDELSKAGVSRNKIFLIYNGIDIDVPSANKCFDIRRELLLKDDDIVIGTVGRLTEQKAQHILFRAIRLIKDRRMKVKCLIAGDGPLLSHLKLIVSQLNLNNEIKFLGYRNDIPAIMSLMDIFVLTSSAEGLPVVLLEAMAMKKAIVSTPVGAIHKIVRNNYNGLIFKFGDIQDLSNCLCQLISNPAKRKELGENALETYKRGFCRWVMVEKYKKIYEAVT